MLCPLNTPSARPPCGARERLAVVDPSAAAAALHTLFGAPVVAGHAGPKCGDLFRAWIEEDVRLMVEGFLFESSLAGDLSFDLCGEFEDRRAPVSRIVKIHRFNHAALLPPGAAAFAGTTITLLPAVAA